MEILLAASYSLHASHTVIWYCIFWYGEFSVFCCDKSWSNFCICISLFPSKHCQGVCTYERNQNICLWRIKPALHHISFFFTRATPIQHPISFSHLHFFESSLLLPCWAGRSIQLVNVLCVEFFHDFVGQLGLENARWIALVGSYKWYWSAATKECS